MRLLEINGTDRWATGRICKAVGELARTELGAEVFYVFSEKLDPIIDSEHEYNYTAQNIYGLYNRVYNHFVFFRWFSESFLSDGFSMKVQTRKLVKYIDKNVKPDIVHLHNMHGYYYHLPTLIHYFNKKKTKIVWTLHDAWLLTGCCPYFIESECNKWKESNCRNCQFLCRYPLQRRDIAKKNLQKKKRMLLKSSNITFVSCSKYLDGCLSESYLGKHNHLVIHNGIDISRFNNQIKDDEQIFTKYGIPFIKNYVLAVAFQWNKRKGDIYIEQLISDLEKNGVKIIVIGQHFNFAKCSNLYYIGDIQSTEELSCFYRNASVLANPTLEDNFPTVDLESICCGTPVVAFDSGGTRETVPDGCGAVVKRKDYRVFCDTIIQYAKSKKTILSSNMDIFDSRISFDKYLKLFAKLEGK